MRIQLIHTYKVLQQIKHFNAYTIILIYNINPDGGWIDAGVNMDNFRKAGGEQSTGELSWGWIDAEPKQRLLTCKSQQIGSRMLNAHF